MNRPWMQFHTRDWLDNKELLRCSDEAQSVLIRLMCLAHEGTPYGYLADQLGPLSDDVMAARCVKPILKFRKAVIELIRYGRLHKDDTGYFVKRMVEDEKIRSSRASGGKLGGNPKLMRKVGVKVEEKVNHIVEPRSDSDSIYSFKSLKPEEKKNATTDLESLEYAWSRHNKHSNEESMNGVFRMVFDKSIDYEKHARYCDYWDKHGWQYSRLTFMGWVNAGQPEPPPEKSEPARVSTRQAAIEQAFIDARE